jgi:hypothetical protein
MRIVPDRGPPVAFASTENCTAPSPVPDAPPVTAIHGTWLTAVHEQPAPVVTLTLPAVPEAGAGCAVELRLIVHPASWAMVTVRPPTVRLPVRAGPVLPANARFTTPLPVPEADDVTDIHVALGTAVQPQFPDVVTSTRPVVALAPIPILSGDTANVHPLA